MEPVGFEVRRSDLLETDQLPYWRPAPAYALSLPLGAAYAATGTRDTAASEATAKAVTHLRKPILTDLMDTLPWQGGGNVRFLVPRVNSQLAPFFLRVPADSDVQDPRLIKWRRAAVPKREV